MGKSARRDHSRSFQEKPTQPGAPDAAPEKQSVVHRVMAKLRPPSSEATEDRTDCSAAESYFGDAPGRAISVSKVETDSTRRRVHVCQLRRARHDAGGPCIAVVPSHQNSVPKTHCRLAQTAACYVWVSAAHLLQQVFGDRHSLQTKMATLSLPARVVPISMSPVQHLKALSLTRNTDFNSVTIIKLLS